MIAVAVCAFAAFIPIQVDRMARRSDALYHRAHVHSLWSQVYSGQPCCWADYTPAQFAKINACIEKPKGNRSQPWFGKAWP